MGSISNDNLFGGSRQQIEMTKNSATTLSNQAINNKAQNSRQQLPQTTTVQTDNSKSVNNIVIVENDFSNQESERDNMLTS